MAVNPFGWSTTAASNATLDGIAVGENLMTVASVNNAFRSAMAGVKEALDVLAGAKTSSGTNTVTLTSGLSLAAYAAGQAFLFKAGGTNTGATTLNIDSVGAKDVVDNTGAALAAGNITSGGYYLVAYSASADDFILLNPTTSSATAVTAAAVITDNRIVRGDGGARGVQESLVVIDDTTGATYPSTDDLGSLGKSGTAWADLFLASGGVINWNAGNYTITHSAGLLTTNGALTITGAIIGTSTFSIGTSNAATVGSIELGHASDSTITRTAAGRLALEGAAMKIAGKETIWIPASAMTSRTTNGAASGTTEMGTNRNMFVTKDFDTTTQEFVQFEVFFPKSWNLGTVTFQPVWSHAATVTNFGVVFGLAGVARSDDDAGDVAFGTAQTSTDTGGTTNDIYIGPESAAITIAGTPAAGDTVQFQLNRTVADGGDTLAVDARLHGIRLFWTSNAAEDT